MKLISNTSEEKIRGAYFTPKVLSSLIVDRLIESDRVSSILEPSCGDGVFLESLRENKRFEKASVTGVEIDPETAEKAKDKTKQKNVDVVCQDFFDFYLQSRKKYDLIVGNPPFIRYQYLAPEERESLSKILTDNGLKSNKLINAWVGFTVACSALLSDHGQLAFIVPAELLQVEYARDLRHYLQKTFSSITIYSINDLPFDDAQQEIVILVCSKESQSKGIRIIKSTNLAELSKKNLASVRYAAIRDHGSKWTSYYSSYSDNLLLEKARNDKRLQPLSDLADISVGVTTGNNDFFSLNSEVVFKYDLSSFCLPLIGKSNHVRGLSFVHADYKQNESEGKKSNLLCLPNQKSESLPALAQAYIREGEKQKINEGYKCKIRDYWYSVPSIWIPDAFFLRRCNRYPKLVINGCKAISTDTMHRIKFHPGVNPKILAICFYNSVSMAFSEICGRSYGGGVLELLPTEAGAILVPYPVNLEETEIDNLFSQINDLLRDGEKIDEVLDLVDRKILIEKLGYSEEICQSFRNIWLSLQDRRLKRGKKL